MNIKKALVLAASPSDKDRIRFENEFKQISSSISRGSEDKTFEVEFLMATHRDEFYNKMLDFKPNILHFITHGEPDGILLEDNDGSAKRVSSETIANYLIEHKRQNGELECVIFNCCFSSDLAKTVRNHFPYVLGIDGELYDDVGIGFSGCFYEALAKNDSYANSFLLASKFQESEEFNVHFYEHGQLRKDLIAFSLGEDNDLINSFIENNYFYKPFPIKEEGDFSRLIKENSDLFQIIISPQIELLKEENIFEVFLKKVKESTHLFPLIFYGVPGSGKSCFLRLFYLYIYEKFTREKEVYPIYIDLNYYEKLVYSDETKLQKSAEEELAKDFKIIQDSIKAEDDFTYIFLIDSVDNYFRTSIYLGDFLVSKIKLLEVKRKKVIGIEKLKNDNIAFTRQKREILFIDGEYTEYDFIPIPTSHRKFNEFVQQYSVLFSEDVESSESRYKNLISWVTKFKLPEVDLAVLRVLDENSGVYAYKESQNFGQFLQTYFTYYLEKNNSNILKASQLAYDYSIRNIKITANEIKENPGWGLLHRNHFFRNFLIAFYVFNQINSLPSGEKKSSILSGNYNYKDHNHVYSYDINKFIKDLFTRDLDSELLFFEKLSANFKKLRMNIKARTHFCYLMGRVTRDEVKNSAKEFLQKLKKQFMSGLKKGKIETNNLNLLYIRTIYISLIVLGDEKANAEYYEHLVKHYEWNDLNRGFHLEYYGDILFKQGDGEYLVNKDILSKDFSFTYNNLISKISNSATKREYYPLLDVDIFTLCSLAQMRHAYGSLDTRKRQSIIDLTQNLLEIEWARNPEILKFVSMVHYMLKKWDNINPDFLLDIIFALKAIPRTGWLDRKIKNPESIASHSHGAISLAMIYLPDAPPEKPEYEDYDKYKIIKMLTIHDWAESIVGDKTPRDDQTSYYEDQKEVFEHITLFGTYGFLPDLSWVCELWEEFENKQSINAKIAKDIDKLDNLKQLNIYQKELTEENYQEFRTSLLKVKIQTDEGKIIKQIIRNRIEFGNPLFETTH